MTTGPLEKSLIDRVFCSQCGATRIRNGRSPFALCPKGHGKLVRRFTKTQERQAVEAVLPEARREGRNVFTIAGHQGEFCYRNGKGRKRARPGDSVEPGEMIARHETKTRRLVRVFSPVESRKEERVA